MNRLLRLSCGGAVWRGAIVFLALVAVVGRAWSAVDPFPGLDAKWRHVRSPHFEIYSRTSESYARNLLASLEAMRAAFLQFMELPVRDATEVTIYAFRSSGPFQTYASPHFEDAKNLIGEYRSFHDRDIILLPTDESIEAARWVIFADLTKNLLQGAGSAGPSWLSQGLSMFFGNFDSGNKYFLLGEPDALRTKLVGEHPTIDVEELFRIEEGRAVPVTDAGGRGGSQKTTNLFHARAWVLFHYWYCGQKDVPAADVNRFVRFLLVPANAARPERVRAQFEEVFKCDYAEMSRRVSRYMRSGRFNSRRLPLPETPAASTYAARPVDELEMRERLAELRLRMRRESLGRYVLIEALQGPRAARAAEALGTDALADGDAERAQEYWQRSIDAGSTNHVILSLVTRMAFARRFSHYDYYLRLPEEKIAALRDLLRRCQERFPDQADYHEMQVWVESAAPEPDVRHVNLAQSKLTGGRLTANGLIGLALVRARLGDRESALQLLASVDKLGPTRAEADFARHVRRILKDPALEEAE